MGDLMGNKFSLVRPPPKPSSEAFLLFKATLKVLMYDVKVKFLISICKKNQINEFWYCGSTAVPRPWEVWDWPAHLHDSLRSVSLMHSLLADDDRLLMMMKRQHNEN